MKRAEIASKLRQHAKNYLSPSQEERQFVSALFGAVQSALGGTCFMSGSYARFTASRPLHDLDVLFVAGRFDPAKLDPAAVLTMLGDLLSKGFRNPTRYRVSISQQSHSVSISFLEGEKEEFSVDVVPVFTAEEVDDFGEDIFWVPEIARTSRRHRTLRYKELADSKKREIDWWIKSDPLGYIRAAAHLNGENGDFRKTVKFIKRWKFNCQNLDETFALKSFHIEQGVSSLYEGEPRIDIFDAIFKYFCEIPEYISRPRIRDRADESKFVDEYVSRLTAAQRQKIIEARDLFLMRLEYAPDNVDMNELLKGGFHERASPTEEYLFDSRIPVFIDAQAHLRVRGNVLFRRGFRVYVLDRTGRIEVERKIRFRAELDAPYEAGLLKWKVKNDNGSPQPRGEITDNRTRNDPEITRYKGTHYVECYAIKDGACFARDRQYVVLERV